MTRFDFIQGLAATQVRAASMGPVRQGHLGSFGFQLYQGDLR